jgi:hypothetical protein
LREGKNGTFMSAKVKRKDRPAGGKAVPAAMPTSIPRPPEPAADFDDDLPF